MFNLSFLQLGADKCQKRRQNVCSSLGEHIHHVTLISFTEIPAIEDSSQLIHLWQRISCNIATLHIYMLHG